MDYTKFINKYVFKGELVVENALHIGSGKDDGEYDAPFIKSGKNGYYIPGSSFRGYLRTKIERFVEGDFGITYNGRKIDNMDIKLLFGYTDVKCDDFRNIKFEKEKENENLIDCYKEIKNRLSIKDDKIDHKVFKQMKGRIHIPDMLITTSVREITRDGIKISRDTGTVENHAKFDYNVLPEDTKFSFEMVLDNIDGYLLDLITLGLNDILNSDIIGGKVSRGVGKCKLKLTEEKSVTVEDKKALENYIFKGKLKSNQDPKKTLTISKLTIE